MPFLQIIQIMIEFDKNANSIRDLCKTVLAWYPFSLATIGVCVFCAFASVDALFVWEVFFMNCISP